jgi:hypothetical protein
MASQRNRRHRAVAKLLRNVRNPRALARGAFVAEALGFDAPAHPDRSALAAQLRTVVERLIEELSGESDLQHRRFEVLRRSDVGGEPHAQVARDVGLSRSQFYRDLHDAREDLARALRDRFAKPPSTRRFDAHADPRFVAIAALRDGGQSDRAHEMADVLARNASPADSIRALCLKAEMEIESGRFAEANESLARARNLLADVGDSRLTSLLRAGCDVAEFEAAHCSGAPADAGRRTALIEGLRREYGGADGEFAPLLVQALIGEGSLRFGQGDAGGALVLIEEALGIVTHEGLDGSPLAVDATIRASGIRALRADHVTAALDQAGRIAEAGARRGDVRAMRVGMQMMAAHLLTLGRLDEAKHYALEASALIDLFGSPLDRAIVLSNLARIDIHRRDGAAALRWIRTARAMPSTAFPIAQALAISEAEALVLVDRAQPAMELVRATHDRVRDWPRLLGRAKLAEALALSALERRTEARLCSFQAVELSHGSCGPLLELRALDLNVRLTGDAHSLHALRELQGALRG